MCAELSELKERMRSLGRELRYAVAGHLGILEVLKRLDDVEARRMASPHAYKP